MALLSTAVAITDHRCRWRQLGPPKEGVSDLFLCNKISSWPSQEKLELISMANIYKRRRLWALDLGSDYKSLVRPCSSATGLCGCLRRRNGKLRL